ncbi:MAG: hypothetical protein AAFN94_01300 [Pseudomonadota bacterium]
MRAVCLTPVFIALTGCLPINTFYAEGVSVEKLKRDTLACDVQALRDAPVANQTRQAPPRRISRKVCNAQGHCYDNSYWVPGEIYTVDVNADLRRRIKTQCMADQGYRPVELPACPQSVAEAAPEGASPVLPRLTKQSCAIRRPGGRLRIVNKG